MSSVFESLVWLLNIYQSKNVLNALASKYFQSIRPEYCNDQSAIQNEAGSEKVPLLGDYIIVLY